MEPVLVYSSEVSKPSQTLLIIAIAVLLIAIIASIVLSNKRRNDRTDRE